MHYRLWTPRICLLLAVLGLAVGLLGCGSSAPTRAPGTIPEAFPNHSPAQIRSLIHQPLDTLHRFSAKARISVRSPQENRSFNASIRQERADSLFMRFSLFGFEGGRMLLTPDSVFLYDSRKHVMRVGPITEAKHIFPAPVASNEVFENLLGLIAPEGTTDWTVKADSNLYRLSNPAGTQVWTVDPRQWRVVRYERRTPQGKVTEIRQFSNFKSVEGVLLPHTVTFRRPREQLMATIEYGKIHLNPANLSYGLGVPPSVPRKPLRQG